MPEVLDTSVEEVVTIPNESIVSPPDTRTGFQNKFIKGIGKQEDNIRLLLDCRRLFQSEEMETLNQIEKEKL